MTSYPTALPPPTPREEIHQRKYDFRGFHRADGLYDIEGRMSDAKTYDFPNQWRGTIPAGEPYHDMRIRLTLDDDFAIVEIAVVTAASPYEICPAINPAFQQLRGARVGPGWSRVLRQHFSGSHGCTHHVEMLRAMGTVAFQTIYSQRERMKRAQMKQAGGESKAEGPPADPGDASGGTRRKPGFLDTCHALASDGEIVRQHWPEFYTGPDQTDRKG